MKLKFQYFGPWCKEPVFGKDPDDGKDRKQEENGKTEDEMIRWHHQFNGHEFEQALGAGDGQGRLACCSAWGCKESVTTEQLNWSRNFSNAKEEWLNVNKSYLCCFHIHSSMSVLVLTDIFCLWLKLQNNFSLVDRVVFAKKLCKNDFPRKAFSCCVSALYIFFN